MNEVWGRAAATRGQDERRPSEAGHRPPWLNPPWTPEEDRLLVGGNLVAAEVAERTGRPLTAGYLRRKNLCVPDLRCQENGGKGVIFTKDPRLLVAQLLAPVYIHGFSSPPTLGSRRDGGRVPSWVCFRVKKDFLKKSVKRKGKYASFRANPEVAGPVTTDDYTGYFKSRDFARGHLATRAVMEGDRDGDGQYADEDPDEEETILQAVDGNNAAGVAKV